MNTAPAQQLCGGDVVVDVLPGAHSRAIVSMVLEATVGGADRVYVRLWELEPNPGSHWTVLFERDELVTLGDAE